MNDVSTEVVTIRKNRLTVFFLDILQYDSNADIPSDLTESEQAVIDAYRSFNADQQASTMTYINVYGAPNALPSIDALNDKKHADIAEAFGPVAIACLHKQLDPRHAINTLRYAHQCAEKDATKLPLLYKLLNLCLSLHIVTIDRLLEWKIIPRRFKQKLIIEKMRQVSGTPSASDTVDTQNLEQAILHLLATTTTDNELSSISSLTYCWLELSSEQIDILGQFCASWSEQALASLEGLTANQDQRVLDIASAQYLHTISSLPPAVTRFFHDLRQALHGDSFSIELTHPTFPAIDSLSEAQVDAMVKTYLHLQSIGENDTQNNPYKPLAFDYISSGLSTFLRQLYQAHIERHVKQSLKDLTPRHDVSSVNLENALANVIGKDEASASVNRLLAETCFAIWKNRIDTPNHAVFQLSQLLLDNHTRDTKTCQRDVLSALSSALEKGGNFQAEYTHVMLGILQLNTPTDQQTPPSELLFTRLTEDLNLIFQGSCHPQRSVCLLEPWKKTWKAWITNHKAVLRLYVSENSDSLPEQAIHWLNDLTKGQDAKIKCGATAFAHTESSTPVANTMNAIPPSVLAF